MQKFALTFTVAMACLFASVDLQAQYPPTTYPPPAPGTYPPGQYPPGQYPPGYPGGGVGIPTRGKKKQQQKENELAQPPFTADGLTVLNDGKKLVIATNDGRIITMTLTAQTRFVQTAGAISPNRVKPRSTVRIQALEDDEFYLTATQVELLKDPSPETELPAGTSRVGPPPEDAARPTVLSKSPEAPDRPILRRGKPTSTSSESASATSTLATKPAKDSGGGDFTIDSDSDQPKIVRTGDDLVDRTKEWAQTFTQGLPNFVCQQDTTRYQQESRSAGFQPVDVLTAKVVYEDGKEDYKEITVGGKRTNKSMLELGGSTSTGEFASTLHSLFAEQSRAEFKFYQSTHVGETPARVYDFKVALANSDWFITVGGQSLHPAYSGSVWIDKGSAQVRRIEMQADNIPKDFPLDSVEWAVDYGEVSLGTAKFLLPIHAENLGCWRGRTTCTKNTIDFRDYHKFSGESTVTFK